MRDLHDDKSGEWVPLKNMWLSRIVVQQTAGALKYDLAIDQSGWGEPSLKAAGYTVNGLRPPAPQPPSSSASPAEPAVDVAGPVVRGTSTAASATVSTKNGSMRLLVGLLAATALLFALVVGVAVGRNGRATS